MSSLVSFDILCKKDNVFEAEVMIVHPDEHHINSSPGYALQLILELYDNIQNGYIYNSDYCFYPFTAEEGEKLITKTNQPLLEQLLELERGKQVSISKKEFDRRQKEQNYRYNGQDVGMGSLGSAYYLRLNPEYDAFCLEAEKHIRKVEVTGRENYPHWFDTFEAWLDHKEFWNFPEQAHQAHDDDPSPVYKLRITLNPASSNLLDHLIEGCRWESAAYDFEGYTKNYKPKYNYTPPQFLLYETENAIIPREDELLTWWQGLTDEWKMVLQKNYFLQRSYFPIQVVRSFSGMMFSIFEDLFPDATSFPEPDVNTLKNMCKMKALYASGCPLKNIKPLEMLRNLKILELESCSISDISPLKGLRELQYLNLYGSVIEDFSEIKNLSNLRYLHFDPKGQESLDMLKDLKGLREIFFFCLDETTVNTGFLKALPDLTKISAISYDIFPDSVPLLKQLKEKGTEIFWELESTEEELSFE